MKLPRLRRFRQPGTRKKAGVELAFWLTLAVGVWAVVTAYVLHRFVAVPP